MAYVKPKKSLGQHFLIDENIAYKIVKALSGSKNVLEIGAGTGVLTKYLIDDKDINLKVIEIDRESVEYLSKNYSQLDGRILEQDFLKSNISDLFNGENLGIIGNFPYNISSQIFFKVIENKELVDEVVCMIQKEVAERIASPEGNKAYGILSVFLQAYYDIEYLFTVSETVFNPPPKVKSAVIKFTRNSRKELDCDEKLFFRIVKTGFNQRRKMLRGSLKPIIGQIKIEHEFMTKRPEQLSVEQFIELTNIVEKSI